MKLELVRKTKTDNSTIGELFVDGKFECYTLEDVARALASGAQKVFGKTAIPEGTYKVVITQSPRFKRLLPLLVNVPYFEGVRIHPGNKAEDTEGCILVGTTEGKDFIGNSRVAFNALFEKMSAAKNEITITIRNN